MTLYGDHYRAIYLKGLAGEKPELPVAWADLEAAAEEAMPEASADYVYATAGTGDTYRENRDAFERYRIVPRMLRDVAERDLSRRALRPDAAGSRRCSPPSASRPPRTRTASARPPARRQRSACRW